MQRSWKHWMVQENDAHDRGVIGVLYAVEKCGIDMTKGIGLFLSQWFPDVLREVMAWLRIVGRLAARISVRFARAAAVIGLWLLIVFGPVTLFPGVISAVWIVIAISGSGWGLWQAHKGHADSSRPR